MLYEFGGFKCEILAVSPDGKSILIRAGQKYFIYSLEGGQTRELNFRDLQGRPLFSSFNEDGSKLAVPIVSNASKIALFDLVSGEKQVLESNDQQPIFYTKFGKENQLFSIGPGGLRSWDLESNTSQILISDRFGTLSPSNRFYFAGLHQPEIKALKDMRVYDLETGDEWSLESHGERVSGLAWHPSEKAVVSGTIDGVIQVGKVTGERPFLFQGHTSGVELEFHPSGDYFFSTGIFDGTLRLWPMPDLSKPPFHTLPHNELIARLKSMTNYRAVKDENSTTGYKIELGPFHGWETVPEW
jgi:WD40 repeat protein